MSENRSSSFPVSVSDAGEPEIRDLLRSAGSRPPVAAGELAEIRSAAKAQWHEMVRMERERKRFRNARTFMALAASLILAVAIGWWLKPGGAPTGSEIVASVELVRGEVLFEGLALAQGSRLAAGTVVETSDVDGAPSRVAVRLDAGQSVRIDSGSRLRFLSASRLDLERGAVYIDTAGTGGAAGVEISTPYGMVRDIGTQFEVRVDERAPAALTVRVREGEVTLERGEQVHSAYAGEELNLEGGDLDRRAIEPSSAAWDWILTATPAMELEGATLSSYLEWVSRETGRELRYEGAGLEQSAGSILVHGSIEGMTPEESLSVVLPGSGLGYLVENGSLIIAKP